MGDKNPKHPLKKKKMVQKNNNVAVHDSEDSQVVGRKKKHVYE